MGCTGSKTDNGDGFKINSTTKFTQNQLELLQKMYGNLSIRCRNKLLTKQVFDVFFHSSGLIGQILFQKFDAGHNGVIKFQQFIKAFEIMVKGTIRQKADVLFEIYDVHKSGSISYSQLLKILFSYPLQQLNKMLIQQPFLKFIGENNMSYYFGSEHRKIEEKIIIEEQSDEESERKGKSKGNRKGSTFVPSSQVLIRLRTDVSPSKIKKNQPDIFKKNNQLAKVESKKKPSTQSGVINTDKQMKNRKALKIQSNVSSLTKKYANFLFISYNLNKDKDNFSKQNFFHLVQQHTALFNVYLSGFHSYIWQASIGQQPQYLSITPWTQNYATESYQDKTNNIYLKYIKSTIFVFDHIKDKMPLEIINLEGLNVSEINKDKKYGIVFTHRDGLYPAKQYYFSQKSIQDQWIKQLSQFKQNSIFNQYLKLERIGGGNYSSVYRGKDKKTDKEVAIKIIQNFKLSTAQRQVIKRECGILRQCHHPNIIKFLAEFKTKTHFYIVTEIMTQGDLFEYTKKCGFIEQYEAALIFRQLVDTILYVNNELGIIHRDLKPENVMIIMNEQKKLVKKIKLIDFGFGVFKDKLQDLPINQKYAGTPGFVAPEIYKQQDFDEKIDTFSLGIILYFMLSGYLPFQSNLTEQIVQLTRACSYSLVNLHWSNVSDEAKDLIHKTLVFKESRISTKQISEHPWLKNIQNLKKYAGRNKKIKTL